jgi:hypothetical protein
MPSRYASLVDAMKAFRTQRRKKASADDTEMKRKPSAEAKRIAELARLSRLVRPR